VFVATAIVTALPPVLKSNVQVAQYRGFKAVGYAVAGIVIGIIIMALIMVHVL
jgi:threonine/homoserine/homoserine lactone efflux protein